MSACVYKRLSLFGCKPSVIRYRCVYMLPVGFIYRRYCLHLKGLLKYLLKLHRRFSWVSGYYISCKIILFLGYICISTRSPRRGRRGKKVATVKSDTQLNIEGTLQRVLFYIRPVCIKTLLTQWNLLWSFEKFNTANFFNYKKNTNPPITSIMIWVFPIVRDRRTHNSPLELANQCICIKNLRHITRKFHKQILRFFK